MKSRFTNHRSGMNRHILFVCFLLVIGLNAEEEHHSSSPQSGHQDERAGHGHSPHDHAGEDKHGGHGEPEQWHEDHAQMSDGERAHDDHEAHQSEHLEHDKHEAQGSHADLHPEHEEPWEHADDSDHGEHEGHEDHAGHDDHDEGIVKIPPEVRREFGIELSRAASGTIHEEVVLPGEIVFNQAELAYITPRYNGTVQDIRVRLADRVKKGDVLAVLENTDTLRPFEVKAPFNGVIVSYDITAGQTVAAGTSLFTVADLSTVWADLQIYQKNFGQIKEGQKVLVSGGNNLPLFKGEIDYVAPTVDRHTRTGLARIVVANPDRVWKPGMFIKGKVVVEEHEVGILVPRTAVLKVEGRPAVFVQTSEGFEARPVEIGHRDDASLQVTQGLHRGETYVSKNPISIKAEMGKGSFGGHHH